MHRALLRLGQILSLTALLAASGGHWVVIQSYAWARMLVENAETCQFSVAVKKTFDGQHPCEICKSIATAKGKEKKLQRTILISKAPLLCPEAALDLRAAGESRALIGPEDELTARSTEPAAPPPRSAAV